MLEQIKLLEKLQQLDAKLLEIEDALKHLPQNVNDLKLTVNGVEGRLEAERQQLAEAQQYKSDLESSSKSEQDQMNKAKAKLSQVRTSKEYMATQRELEVTRKSTSDKDEELLKLMEAIEASKKSIAIHEGELKELVEHVQAQEAETAVKLEELKQARDAQIAERDQLASTVRRDVLNKYRSIQRRRPNPVVEAKRGVCTGCNMALPPQLYIILQRQATLELCPSCQRIVYFQPAE